jgi:putative nucleotidyltransferase with HDIG domain
MYTLKELIDILINVKKLSTLSPIALMLMHSLNEEEPDVHRISRIISDDPPTAGMILKLANSAMYGGRRTISTVQDSIVRLGFQELRKLVIDITMVKYLSAMPESVLDPVGYWKHSIGVAFCMEEIQDTTNLLEKDGPLCHVVGLLHDIGRLITATHMPEVHQQFSEDSEEINSPETVIVWEKEVIGLDHTQIGAAVLEHWDLPMEIVNGVRYHHQPDISPKPQRKASYLACLADCICRKLKLGSAGEGLIEEIEESLWKELGVSSGIAGGVIERVQEKVGKSEVLLSIGGLNKQ